MGCNTKTRAAYEELVDELTTSSPDTPDTNECNCDICQALFDDDNDTDIYEEEEEESEEIEVEDNNTTTITLTHIPTDNDDDVPSPSKK